MEEKQRKQRKGKRKDRERKAMKKGSMTDEEKEQLKERNRLDKQKSRLNMSRQKVFTKNKSIYLNHQKLLLPKF